LRPQRLLRWVRVVKGTTCAAACTRKAPCLEHRQRCAMVL
jgi:hypothetical protein